MLDFSKWTFQHPDGTLYRITGMYDGTFGPIYDYKLPNERWSCGYYGRPWTWFKTLKRLD